MNRPTVQNIVDAYAKTGWKPARSTCWERDAEGRECGCAAGVLAAVHGCVILPREVMRSLSLAQYANNIYGKHFTAGLMAGFDGLGIDLNRYRDDPDFLAGHEVGKAALAAVVPEGKW